MAKYQVIEDNGGGLHLFILRGRKVVAAFTGYEYNPGHLSDDIAMLEDGGNISDWESNVTDPQATYDEITGYEYGWEIVAAGGKGRRNLYKARMGRAAQIEFGVSDEDIQMSQVAAALGRKGGSATTEAKQQASRENGRKGGRPKKKS